MKAIIVSIVTAILVATGVSVPSAWAEESKPCVDVASVVKYKKDDENIQTLINAFTDYKNYKDLSNKAQSLYSKTNQRYEICAINPITITSQAISQVQTTTPTFTGSFSFSPAAGDEVYIHGLDISVTTTTPLQKPLLSITHPGGDKTITIDDVELSDVEDGLKLSLAEKAEVSGTNSFIVKKSTITGSSANTGVCIDVKSDKAKIMSSEFSSCDTGILIKGKGVIVKNSTITGPSAKTGIGIDVKANHAVMKSNKISSWDTGLLIEADKTQTGPEDAPDVSKLDDPNLKAMNEIYDNNLGIYVKSGTENRFAYSSIYDNLDGIKMDTGTMLPELWQPEVVVDKETKKALVCTKDSAGKVVVSRQIKFKVKEDGDIVIYEPKKEDIILQGKKYLTKCAVKEDGNCDLNDFMKSYGVTDEKCGDQELSVVALFDSPTGTTMYTKEKFVPDGFASLPAVPVIMPGGTSGMGGGTATSSDPGTVESGGGPSDTTAWIDGTTMTLGEGSGGSVIASSAGEGGTGMSAAKCSLSPQGRMSLDWLVCLLWIVCLGMLLALRGITRVRRAPATALVARRGVRLK